MSEVGYTRDASWHNNPDTTSPKKVHRLDAGMAACRPGRIILDTDGRAHDVEKLRAENPTMLCGRCFPATVGASVHRGGHDNDRRQVGS